MVNRIKDSVGDFPSQIRGDGDQQEKAKDDISRNHDFHGKLLTKRLIPIVTDDAKEHEEDNNSTEEHQDQSIPNSNMTLQHFVEWNDGIKASEGSFGNDETAHCEWKNSQLEQNGVHCTKFKGWHTNFPRTSWSTVWDHIVLSIVLFHGMVC
jgi:hypothetical protein